MQNPHNTQRGRVDLVNDQIPGAHHMKTHSRIRAEISAAVSDFRLLRQLFTRLQESRSSLSAAAGLSAATNTHTSKRSERTSSLRTNCFIRHCPACAISPSPPPSTLPLAPPNGPDQLVQRQGRPEFSFARLILMPDTIPSHCFPLLILTEPHHRKTRGDYFIGCRESSLSDFVLNELFKRWSNRHVHG